MTARFAGSRTLDERRRRWLATNESERCAGFRRGEGCALRSGRVFRNRAEDYAFSGPQNHLPQSLESLGRERVGVRHGRGHFGRLDEHCRFPYSRSGLDEADPTAGRAVGPAVRDRSVSAQRAVCFFHLVGAFAKPAGLRRTVSRLAVGSSRFDARCRRIGRTMALGLERHDLLAVVCPVSPAGRAVLDGAGLDRRRRFVAEAPGGHAGLHRELAAVVARGGGVFGCIDLSAGDRPHGLG